MLKYCLGILFCIIWWQKENYWLVIEKRLNRQWKLTELSLKCATIQHISVTERSLKVAFQQKLKCGVSSYGRRKWLIFSSWIFTPFRFYILFRKRVGPSFQQKWISFTQGCIVPSCGWNSPSDSGEDFWGGFVCVCFFIQFFEMYFRYFSIFSPLKRVWPFV